MKKNTEAHIEVERRWKEDKLKTKSDRIKAAEEIGIHPRTVGKWVTKLDAAQIKPKKMSTKCAAGGLDAFRSQYDFSVIVPKKIAAGVERHLRNGNGEPSYLGDQAFREACEVPIGKWRRYADEFKHLQVPTADGIVWGHPEIIDMMRRAVQS